MGTLRDLCNYVDAQCEDKNIIDKITFMQSKKFKRMFPDYGAYNYFIDEYRFLHPEYSMAFKLFAFDKQYTRKEDFKGNKTEVDAKKDINKAIEDFYTIIASNDYDNLNAEIDTFVKRLNQIKEANISF